MSTANLRAGAVITLLFVSTVLCSVVLRKQHKSLTALRQENLEQRVLVEQLTVEMQGLSNRLVQMSLTQASPQDAPREILRLRGEIGMLRSQIRDFQRLTGENESSRSNGLSPETVQQLQVRGQKVYEALKALRDQCQGNETDREALLQNAFKHDAVMVSLMVQKEIATKALADPGLPSARFDDVKGFIADVDSRIKQRSEGFLFGLDVRVGALRELLDGLGATEGAARLRAIAELDNAVRGAAETVGASP